MGTIPVISEGEYLVVEGTEGKHSSYGEQFQVMQSEVQAPKDRVAMERYLGSGAIKGVGVNLAEIGRAHV